MQDEASPIHAPALWWAVKVIAGVGVIAWFALSAFTHPPIAAPVTFLFVVGQVVVVTGALVHLVHYGILKRQSPALSAPVALVTRGGLYGWIRHPMYLGDALVLLGFTLMKPDAVTVLFGAAGILAIDRQCAAEDDQLLQMFGSDFVRWEESTRRFIPGLR